MTVFIKNFYSSVEQYREIDLLAFDEGPRVYTKYASVNSSSIDTSAIDQYRQGVEITQEKYVAGLVKISAGTAGHIIKPRSYGDNDVGVISTSNFVEIDYFDPIEYLRLQEPGSNITKVITFPIVTNDSNQKENYILNGIIEPLSIRPVASFYSIEFPFESRAVRGAYMGGNTDAFKFSSDEVLTVDYVPKNLVQEKTVLFSSSLGWLTSSFKGGQSFENKAWFLDSSESLLSGSNISPETGIPQFGNGNLNPNLNFVRPFDDSKTYLQTLGLSAEKHGQDIINAFKLMSDKNDDNYVPFEKKSATAGFVYNVGGTDSIAFGGMTY